MATHDEIERVRQAVMRFRELLDITQARLEAGERSYNRLFDGCSAEDKAALPEKTLQWQVAEQIVDDTTALRKALMQVRYDLRDVMQEFEHVHDILVTAAESD